MTQKVAFVKEGMPVDTVFHINCLAPADPSGCG